MAEQYARELYMDVSVEPEAFARFVGESMAGVETPSMELQARRIGSFTVEASQGFNWFINPDGKWVGAHLYDTMPEWVDLEPGQLSASYTAQPKHKLEVSRDFSYDKKEFYRNIKVIGGLLRVSGAVELPNDPTFARQIASGKGVAFDKWLELNLRGPERTERRHPLSFTTKIGSRTIKTPQNRLDQLAGSSYR